MKKILLLFIVLFVSNLNAQKPVKKILFVMSSASELPLQNGKKYTNTGVFLSEFYLAYKDLIQEGYEIDFATPNGKKSFIDQESFSKKYWSGRDELIQEATTFTTQNPKFLSPITTEQALAEEDKYSAVIVPGGQGLMVDLINDENTLKLISKIGSSQRGVGLICHAPALLLKLGPQNPFKGFKVNCVTGIEEFFIETFVMKGKPYNRKIGKQLSENGYIYVKGRPAKNFAVREKNLVTSQNPFSNKAFSTLFIQLLKEIP